MINLAVFHVGAVGVLPVQTFTCWVARSGTRSSFLVQSDLIPPRGSGCLVPPNADG